MKTEDHAWALLQEHAAAQLRPGFANRVIRATRAGADRSTQFLRPFAVCAAAATLCLIAASYYRTQASAEENARNLAGWQEITSQADELDQTL